MFRFILVGGAVLSLFQTTAASQILVDQNSEAYACYLRVEQESTAYMSSVRVCRRALLSRSGLRREDRAATHVNLGILHMRQGDYVGAFSEFDTAIELRPKLADAYLNRGVNLIYLERYDEAAMELSTSIEYGTGHLAEALYNRALAYEGTGNVDGAYADLLRAKDLRPDWNALLSTLERYTVVGSAEPE